MNFSNWVERHRDKLGSEYEIIFAEQVLPLVEGLQCDVVTPQYAFVDSDGKNRYCDFIIIESEAVRVAIEIDGYDKRGTGTGMSYADFLDWQRRQASLASQGWPVLLFANREVSDEPLRCARHISRLLNRLRQAQTGRVEIITTQSKPQGGIAVPAKVENAKLSAHPEILPLSAPERLESAVASRTVKLPVEHLPEVPTKRNHKLLLMVALTVLVALVLWQNSPTVATQVALSNSPPPRYVPTDALPAYASPARTSTLAGTPVPVALVGSNAGSGKPSYGTLNCRNPLDWSFAKKYIGQVVTVIGPLVATKPMPNVTGSPMWLDVGNLYPSRSRLTVVVWGKHWSKFDARQLNAKYWSETIFDEVGYASICITGKVSEYKGVPQIELQDPSQFKIAFHPN